VNPPENQPPFHATQRDWAVLRQSQPSDYDGHTGFDRMTPAARLEWLDTAVQFVADAAGRARKDAVL